MLLLRLRWSGYNVIVCFRSPSSQKLPYFQGGVEIFLKGIHIQIWRLPIMKLIFSVLLEIFFLCSTKAQYVCLVIHISKTIHPIEIRSSTKLYILGSYSRNSLWSKVPKFLGINDRSYFLKNFAILKCPFNRL